MVLNIDDNRTALAIPPIFRLAFRPLFLGGSLFALLAIAWWVYFWIAPFDWQPYGGVIWWHSHEMIFGFGSAIIVGFLLTAVQNWTGVTGLRGTPLALLFFFWLAGRIVVGFNIGLPPLLVALTDCAFLFLSSIAMAYPVIKVKQWRNLIFAPILLILMLQNVLSHYAVNTHQADLALRSIHAAIMMVTLVISIVGGRVIPFFTASATKTARKPNLKWLDAISIGSIILLFLSAIVGFTAIAPEILAAIATVAALANASRFLRWGIQYCWQIPLLWSLQLAYAFIPLGMLALALYGTGVITSLSVALHSFTVGAMGGMVLAMISRVTLGHTGRPLQPPKAITFAFIAILLAGIIRVVLPGIFPEYSRLGVGIAGGFWVAAYGIYCFYYAPMLLTTRADGRPG